jgi:hypothetical protein
MNSSLPKRPITTTPTAEAKSPPPPTLEERVSSALRGDGSTPSSAIALLIMEVSAAAEAAAQSVEQQRAAALDLDSALDPTAVLTAELARDRLRAALPRLQRLLAEAEDREYSANWDARFRRVESMVEEAARKFARYPALVGELIELMTSTAAVDSQVSEINGAAPAGEMRRLRGVELAARRLNNFTADQPPIAQNLRLPDWHSSSQLVWPQPHNVFDPGAFMPIQRGDPRLTSDSWWQVGDEQRAVEEAREQREAIEAEEAKKQFWQQAT